MVRATTNHGYMGFEDVPQISLYRSQEEIDAIEDERTLHDAALIKQGAHREQGILQPTDEQVEQMRAQMQYAVQYRQFEGTEEKKVLETHLRTLETLEAELRFYCGLNAGPLAGKERIRGDAEYERALSILSIPKPQNRDEERQLLRQIEAKSGYLRGVLRVLQKSPSLRIGSLVNIQRSSGTIEPGWQIKEVTPEAEFVVVDPTETLLKTVPILEVAEVN